MTLLQTTPQKHRYTPDFGLLGKPTMLGQLIGDRYEIIEILGSGNMANTYLTEDLGRDRQRCVVKRLNSSHPDPKMLEAKKQLFAREAASLHALGKHSQIPQRLAYVENSEDCYLVQEFVDGYPLMEGIIPGEQWTSFQVVQFLEEMLSCWRSSIVKGSSIATSNPAILCDDTQIIGWY